MSTPILVVLICMFLLKNGPYLHVFTENGPNSGAELKGPYSFILIVIVHGFAGNDPYLHVFT